MYENTLSSDGSGVQNETFSIVWSMTRDLKQREIFALLIRSSFYTQIVILNPEKGNENIHNS